MINKQFCTKEAGRKYLDDMGYCLSAYYSIGDKAWAEGHNIIEDSELPHAEFMSDGKTTVVTLMSSSGSVH